MKPSIVLFALTAATLSAQPEDYVNFVRQTQEDTGVEWDVTVAPSGEMLSLEGVGEAGSLFQLWSIHSFRVSEYLLDEEFVSSYTPEVTISITSRDPYEVIPRTRVDQPFTVTIRVEGLLSGPDLPSAAQRVLLTHEGFVYPEGVHGFPEGVERMGSAVDQSYVSENGEAKRSHSITSLMGPDLTQIEGEEEFVVWAVSEDGLGEEILDSAVLQVWPLAGASIFGIEPGVTYEQVPPIHVVLTDLYPDSETYVRITKGAPGSGGTAVPIEASYVLIDDVVPQDREILLDGVDSFFPRTGEYTIEVVHKTPFGLEILERLFPIVIDRTVAVHGAIYARD